MHYLQWRHVKHGKADLQRSVWNDGTHHLEFHLVCWGCRSPLRVGSIHIQAFGIVIVAWYIWTGRSIMYPYTAIHIMIAMNLSYICIVDLLLNCGRV